MSRYFTIREAERQHGCTIASALDEYYDNCVASGCRSKDVQQAARWFVHENELAATEYMSVYQNLKNRKWPRCSYRDEEEIPTWDELTRAFSI